ncbi:MAG: hypothetical protein ABL921_13695 [Pirellula sp.]
MNSNSKIISRLALLLVANVLFFSVGCGPEKEKLFRVHGQATFKGKAIPKGNVFFDPDLSKGTSGQQGFAGIVDGAFDTSAPDGQGIRKGAYVIRVQAFDGKALPDYPFGTGLTTEFVMKKSFTEDDNTLEIAIGK